MSLKAKNAFNTLAKTIMLLKRMKTEQEKSPPDDQIRAETIRLMDANCSEPAARVNTKHLMPVTIRTLHNPNEPMKREHIFRLSH
jgi:hypothetical protein